jgi:DNA-directed RNA polymerase subunit H (RpoH/RPB5)
MLEIILLIFISRNIAETAFDKGYSRGLYRFLTFLFWFAFEFIGLIIATIFLGEEKFLLYLVGWLSGGLGYLILHIIVENLPELSPKIVYSVYVVNSESLPVYEKTTEYSKVIKEYKKGDIIEIDRKSDFDRFYKIYITPSEKGYILKSSDIIAKV